MEWEASGLHGSWEGGVNENGVGAEGAATLGWDGEGRGMLMLKPD